MTIDDYLRDLERNLFVMFKICRRTWGAVTVSRLWKCQRNFMAFEEIFERHFGYRFQDKWDHLRITQI